MNDDDNLIVTSVTSPPRFIWNRVNVLLGTSEVVIVWDIPLDTPEGTYRIRYFGNSKNILQTVSEFVGTTRPFKVTSLSKSATTTKTRK